MLSGLVVKQRRQALGVRGPADALLRDDAGDQVVVRHVEGGVVALHLRQGHGLFIPQRLDLLRVPQLDGDVVPVGAVHVDGGGGPQHVDGDAVVLGQDGHAGGADLVGGVAVGGDPVAAHEAGLDPAVPHDDGGHVVADQRHVHARPLVSSANTRMCMPRSAASRKGPWAVPYREVARGPALQWVSTPSPSFSRLRPYSEMALHLVLLQL